MSVVVEDPVATAYDAFAGFYDAFTAHHDDETWTRNLEALAHSAGLSGRRLLDLGCGTGRSFLPMLDRGYAVTATDLSAKMLDQAERKAAGRARLVRADLRTLPDLGTFDLVWSLSDVFNNLASGAELAAAIRRAAASLAPGGVLLFDVNTLASFRRVYSALWVRPVADHVLILDGHGSPDVEPGGRSEVWIDRLVREDGDAWSRVRTVHRLRHHPEGQVRSALAAAGLDCVAVHGSRPDGELDPWLDEREHVKAVYVARRRRVREEGGGEPK